MVLTSTLSSTPRYWRALPHTVAPHVRRHCRCRCLCQCRCRCRCPRRACSSRCQWACLFRPRPRSTASPSITPLSTHSVPVPHLHHLHLLVRLLTTRRPTSCLLIRSCRRCRCLSCSILSTCRITPSCIICTISRTGIIPCILLIRIHIRTLARFLQCTFPRNLGPWIPVRRTASSRCPLLP
jgi:hypothetical protein